VSRYDQHRRECPGALAPGRGTSALVQVLARWRRAIIAGRAPAGPAELATAGVTRPAGPPELGELVRRLDDTGCAYGRVSAARLEHLTRAYERLEMKLNAVLMAATGTFLSTLAGLLLYYVRGGSH